MPRCTSGLMVVLAWLLVPGATAWAYVDLAPTLGRIVRESQEITLAEVDRFSRDKGAVILRKVRDLKGQTGAEPIKHLLVRSKESGVDWPLLEWAAPGRRCVLFQAGKAAIVCVGEGWYQVQAGENGWWQIGVPRPDLPLAYYGSVSRLAEAVPLMVAGKSAVITTLPHGADQQGASFDLALNRAGLPGLVKVQRIRASLSMPSVAMGVGSNPAYVLGMGRADREDLPALREKLRARDAAVRAESAADIGFLGPDAAAAAGELAKLLEEEPPVRLAAASTLLRVKRGDTSALDVLGKGLTSPDAGTRQRAARAVGLTGPAAAALAPRLAALLADSDPLIRRTALQALGTLGPSTAGTRYAVTALLAQRETAIDAADALGRMGAAARPSLKALTALLSSESPAERWAAVRAMAQIGGPDAAPAVTYLIGELPKASEIDGYNMLLYLALLGPVARDAIPAVRTARVRNPVLRQMTAWAIDPGEELPWFGGFGNVDFAQYIFTAYVQELGDHLQPAARSLARKMMAGKAGQVPTWGYKLLARFPEDTLPLLTAGLTDKELVMRERAAVALGYMGRAAASAKPQVTRALKAATDEKEQLLLKWCLREMEAERGN
jgi:HEAT repeat protein